MLVKYATKYRVINPLGTYIFISPPVPNPFAGLCQS